MVVQISLTNSVVEPCYSALAAHGSAAMFSAYKKQPVRSLRKTPSRQTTIGFVQRSAKR